MSMYDRDGRIGYGFLVALISQRCLLEARNHQESAEIAMDTLRQLNVLSEHRIEWSAVEPPTPAETESAPIKKTSFLRAYLPAPKDKK